MIRKAVLAIGRPVIMMAIFINFVVSLLFGVFVTNPLLVRVIDLIFVAENDKKSIRFDTSRIIFKLSPF